MDYLMSKMNTATKIRLRHAENPSEMDNLSGEWKQPELCQI